MEADTALTAPTVPAPDAPAPAAAVLERGGRVATLDGLRGWAVLMVMTFHFMYDPSLNRGLARPLFLLTHVGQTGVDLFFVLSGFLITGILVDSKAQPHFFRNFYLRRTLRIFPLYFGVLIVLYAVLPLFGVASWWPEWRLCAGHQIWQWVYLTNVALFLDIPQLPGHFWTLAVEEHFYLLWPLLVFTLDERQLRRACLGIILAALATRAVLAWCRLDTFYLTPCRMDALAMGAWLALEVRRNHHPATLLRLARWVALLSAVLLLPTYVLATGSHNPVLEATKFSIIGLFYGALLLWLTLAPRASFLARCATHPLWVFFGKYSYGLYVFHVFVLSFLPRWFGMADLVRWLRFPLLGIGAWLVLATAAALVPAWLSWHLYERPFLRFKRHFSPYAETRQAASH